MHIAKEALDATRYDIIEKAHGKAYQALNALFRATRPKRMLGPLEDDLEEAAHMLRIALEAIEELRRDVKNISAKQ